MESITLLMLELELANYRKLDLQKKIDIAANIFDRIKETSSVQNEGMMEKDLMDKISTLTGVSASVLQQIRKLDCASIKFKEWSREIDVSSGMNVLYATMKKRLQDYYTNDRKIITKSEFSANLKTKYKGELIKATFNKYFTTIPVPRTQQCIIVEKPEIVLRRHQYLRKKMELTKEGKVFVYIEETTFFGKHRTSVHMCRPQNNMTKRLVLAVAPELGYVDSIYCSRLPEYNMRHWLEETVIPVLPKGCVFVFEDGLFQDVFETPESHSSKQEMVDWLHREDIPHDPKSHRAELYALIETYKKSSRKTRKTEQLLKLNGHTALSREDGVTFEYFEPFWKKLKDILNTKCSNIVSRNTIIRKQQIPFVAKRFATLFQKEYWIELEKKLTDFEFNAYRKDVEMEQIIDKLMAFTESVQFNPGQFECNDYCEAVNRQYIFS